jgi:hemolysin III
MSLSIDFTKRDRPQTTGEEIANSITHGIAFLAAAAVTPFLIIKAFPAGGAAITGASIFGAAMILLYLASTLYHSLPAGKSKRFFRIIDHCAIFLLIAGTYTPFTLAVLEGAWGWTLFGIVWTLAALGVLMKTISTGGTSRLSIALYLGMGWLALLAVKPLYESMPAWGLFWILAGGIMYSAGVVFFAYDHRMKYNHFIWHLFVMAGTGCHVVAVLGYAF